MKMKDEGGEAVKGVVDNDYVKCWWERGGDIDLGSGEKKLHRREKDSEMENHLQSYF